MKHAFTIDLEDWYQGIPLSAGDKLGAERRLHIGTDRLLELLNHHNVRATFFALSLCAKEHPGILRRISDAGHDIGSHGLSHDRVYEMSPDRFREETRTSITDLEDCIGRPIRSYRAAYFSITQASLWALDILVSLGIRFDSSIFPVRHWAYGIPGFSRLPLKIETAAGPILEFPISTRRIFGCDIPAAGGAYFRVYPYALTRSNIRAAEALGQPVVCYLHPWELDPEHPRRTFDWRLMLTHYINLQKTAPRLEQLLSEFEFTTLGEVLENEFPGLCT